MEIQAPRIQCRDYIKCNTESDTMAARYCKIYTCVTKNPELDIFWTGKQMNPETCLEISMIIFFF